jgi:hypothetical protein
MRPSKLVRVRKDIETLVHELAELTGYEASTVRNMALLLGLEKLAYLARKEVKKGHPPTPFLSDAEYWRLHEAAQQSIEELRQALLAWRGRGVEVYA